MVDNKIKNQKSPASPKLPLRQVEDEASQRGEKIKSSDEERIEELEKENQVLGEQAKRTLADYQNLEKRVAEEKGEWIKSANKELLFKLLPIFDTLTLAHKHIQDEGLNLSVKQFIDVLQSVGVEKIDTQNQTFDPSTMEAVEKTGEGEKVIEEMRPGFTLFGKVLRPAQVKVG